MSVFCLFTKPSGFAMQAEGLGLRQQKLKLND